MAKVAARFSGDWDRFMQILINRGECNLLGYRGSGKSLLGFAILEQLLADGHICGVLGNAGLSLPVANWAEYLEPDEARGWGRRPRGLEQVGVYIDEAGTVFDNRSFATNPTDLARYLRKMRTMLIFMSVTPIDKRFTRFQVTPLDKIFGRWNYHFELLNDSNRVVEQGKITLKNPEQFFGRFDTYSMPTDDADLLPLFEWSVAWRANASRTNAEQWFVADEQDGGGSLASSRAA